jgi:putative tryptophan/tyrosine transport system substrate-binding protein
MRRRDFFTFVGGAAAWPLAAEAQGRVPVIGILDPDVPWIFDAFVGGMRDLGYVEGQNIAYARRSLQGKNDAVPAIVAELVASKADVIVTVAPTYVRAVRRAAPSIPVVFLASGDPVSAGIVDSFAHPGRRTTGLSFVDEDLSTKRLDLIRQLVPNLGEVAVFYFAVSGKNSAFERTERTARALGLEVRGWPIANAESLDAAFQDVAKAHVQALDVLSNPFFNANRELLVRLAEKYRLPAIYESGEYVRSGGLIAYGPVFVDMARRGATFVDKILKGADPGDIPVEITTKFALSINLKAASALGLQVPPAVLAAADEVIE